MATTSDYFPDYPDEYHQSFQTIMNYGLRFRELRYKEDSKKIVAKLQLKSYNEVHVLSIGSGNGSVDLHFINALMDKYITIHYTVIEPVSGPLDEFKRLIESREDKWNRVNFSFHVQGITEYLKEGGTADKCDPREK
ncbi:histamine N-methyltransferase-like [Saccoglossus kowalevskii]